ncbi:MAG: hypothetical protein HY549_08910 [Elusimicrobia bacterium]|nr:hypothetical protein [Elusimicrobiota bacterium]
MNKIFRSIAVSICFVSIRAPLTASAQQIPGDAGGWHISVQGDYMGVGNADSTIDTSNVCHPFMISLSATSCSVSTKGYGAEGFRIGLFHGYNSGTQFGPSVGYLNGGPGVGTANFQFGGSPTKIGVLSDADTMRFLGEARQTWLLSGSLGVRIGAGVGIAVEKRTRNYTCTNASCGPFALPDYSSLGWLTWEISPAMVYRSINLGLRYVGFSRGTQKPWNTIGAFFGIDL